MVTSRRMRRVELAPAAMAANRAAQRHNMLRLSRYTHRIAISNRRLISADGNGITFRYKDYRLDGAARIDGPRVWFGWGRRHWW